MLSGNKRIFYIIIIVLSAGLYIFGKTAKMYMRPSAPAEHNQHSAGYTENAVPSNPHTSKATVRVVKVVDGDTLELDSGDKVRLIGIDTPEKDQYCYKEAKNLLKKLVEDKDVTLEFDVQQADKYGRLLGYVRLAGRDKNTGEVFVNKALLEEGVANVYTIPPNVKYAETFVQAQKMARNNNAGLWKEKRAPADFYVGSKKSGVFHRNICKSVEQIQEHNRLIFKTSDEALDEGKSPCRTCKP